MERAKRLTNGLCRSLQVIGDWGLGAASDSPIRQDGLRFEFGMLA